MDTIVTRLRREQTAINFDEDTRDKHNKALLTEGFVIEGPAGTKCAVP
jgi:hypothetical protein